MTAEDLPAAFADFPPAWSQALPGWTPSLVAEIVARVRHVSGERAIAPADPFRALRLVGPEAVKVVVLGQDPYPTAGHADGLAFSAGRGRPRSLARIFEVLAADRPSFRPPEVWSLDGWARQGVLLLNPVLSVEVGRAGSHERCGWQDLTGRVVALLCARQQPPVFLLWGSRARAFFESVAPAEAAPPGPAPPKCPPVLERAGGRIRAFVARHPSYDFKRDFMRAGGSHFVATQDLVDWWAIGRSDEPVV